MNVAELIEVLKQMPQNGLVIHDETGQMITKVVEALPGIVVMYN